MPPRYLGDNSAWLPAFPDDASFDLPRKSPPPPAAARVAVWSCFDPSTTTGVKPLVAAGR
jgi:hypothetical protein